MTTPTPQPYPAYRPSNVPWLGDVPAHWEVRPGRAAFQEIIERGNPDEQLLSVTIARGVIAQETLLQDSSQKDSSRLDKSDYKLVCPGDIVYNKMRAWQGAVGVSDFRGIVSPAYVVQRPRFGSEPAYFHHLMRLPAFATEAERWSYGIASDMWSLRPEHFKMIQFPLPPLAEQRAIVRYLDHVDGRIRRYVSAKRRLIALLEEERQAVVNRAVTRGLDPNVRLKPSGVPWLGDVPEHWEVRRLKNWVNINEAVLPETTEPDFEFPYLEIGAVGTGLLISQPTTIKFGSAPSRARRIVRTGDTIVSTVRTYLRATWFAEEVNGDLICSTGFAVLTPHNEACPKLVSYLAQSNALTDRVTASSVGTAYPAIAESRLGSFHVPIPPVNEQAAIVEYLDRATADVDAAVARARRQIELVEEYRTRLIADVVTGKLDVRQAAGGLPEADQDVPIDKNHPIEDNDEPLVEDAAAAAGLQVIEP